MEFWDNFVSDSTVSPHLRLHVGIANRFNRLVVFVYASRADCRFILTC